MSGLRGPAPRIIVWLHIGAMSMLALAGVAALTFFFVQIAEIAGDLVSYFWGQ